MLGLAVWSLEVARAVLDPSSYPGAVLAAAEDPDDDAETGFIRETTLRPSAPDEDAVSWRSRDHGCTRPGHGSSGTRHYSEADDAVVARHIEDAGTNGARETACRGLAMTIRIRRRILRHQQWGWGT